MIGLAYCKIALERGHQVIGLSRKYSNILDGWVDTGRFQFIEADLFGPDWGAIKGLNVDVCLHCAWIAEPGIYWESPLNAAHADAAREIFLRLRESNPAIYISCLGTCAEYAPKETAFIETDPVTDSSAYTAEKIRLHEFLNTEFEQFSWVRLFYPYGPTEHPKRILSFAISSLLNHQTVELKTPFSEKDYIYIDDVAATLEAIIDTRVIGAINVGSGTAVAIHKLVEIAEKQLGLENLIRYGPRGEEPLDRTLANVDRMKEIGCIPKVDLEEGVRYLVDSITAKVSR